MNFNLKELTYEYMEQNIHFVENSLECSPWVLSLPPILRFYAISAIFKVNEDFTEQRKTEKNRQIVIKAILQEIKAMTHEHLNNGVLDSPLVEIMK